MGDITKIEELHLIIDSLHDRLENSNAYWRYAAADVMNDGDAVSILSHFFTLKTVKGDHLSRLPKLSAVPFAKLAAARFVRFGVDSVQITEIGEDCIEGIMKGRSDG